MADSERLGPSPDSNSKQWTQQAVVKCNRKKFLSWRDAREQYMRVSNLSNQGNLGERLGSWGVACSQWAGLVSIGGVALVYVWARIAVGGCRLIGAWQHCCEQGRAHEWLSDFSGFRHVCSVTMNFWWFSNKDNDLGYLQTPVLFHSVQCAYLKNGIQSGTHLGPFRRNNKTLALHRS